MKYRKRPVVIEARRTQDEQHKADIAALTGRVDLLSRMVADYRHEVDEMRREQNAHNDVLSDPATYDLSNMYEDDLR